MDFGLESGNEDLAKRLVYGHEDLELSSEDRALCAFAAKLTRSPAAMSREDVDRLREHGFTDEQITIAVQVISYFNYINRIADALGVDDEPGMTPGRAEWHDGRRAPE